MGKSHSHLRGSHHEVRRPSTSSASRAPPAAPVVKMERPFRCEDRAAIPDQLVEGPFEDFEIAGDVYATAYLIARNATPDLYSINPWSNPDVRVVWLYLLFIIGSQLFVIVSITLWYPPSVRSESQFVDCANATAVAALHARGFLEAATEESCRRQGTWAFEAELRGTVVAYHTVEKNVFFHEAILCEGGVVVYLLRLICSIWVFSQVYLQEFESVRSLFDYHDFSRWFLPLKGERVRNSWALCIPLMQYLVVLTVTTVSFAIICAQNEPFDIVMNSLAFTFIAEVGSFFNDPLAKRMGSTIISSADVATYGSIFYLYPEYKQSNAIRDDGSYTDGGWYICDDEEKAGLLCDYKVRHNPKVYPHPLQTFVSILECLLFVVPGLVVLLGSLHSRSLHAADEL